MRVFVFIVFDLGRCASRLVCLACYVPATDSSEKIEGMLGATAHLSSDESPLDVNVWATRD